MRAMIGLPLRLAFLTVVAVAAAYAGVRAQSHAAAPHHEMHLLPVGPSVSVAYGGKRADVALATAWHDGPSVALLDVWKAAFPADDPKALRFDLVGSDGFRPTSRPKCTRLLTGAEVAAARIDLVSHDVAFDDALSLPGCYRVKALVGIEATR
jgi:hypothetical protein